MSEISERITAIIKRGLTPYLKKEGFIKSGTHFHKICGDAILVVNTQSSQWNMSGTGKFRVNLGIHFGSVARLLFGTDPMPKVPKEYHCLLRRLLSQGVVNPWWHVDAQANTTALAEELAEFWRGDAWPWLSRNLSLSEAARELELMQHNYWIAAAAHLVLSEPEVAVRLLKTAVDALEKDLPTAQEINRVLTIKRLAGIRAWAKAQNLDIG